MSELAFNVNGEPFEVPAGATGWRVRRLKQKGAPEVVYGRDGLPLVLGIDAGLDELRAESNVPGRYRLDPVDDAGKPVASAQAGYVFVHAEYRNAETASPVVLPAASDSIVIEAMRMNAEIARSVVDRFPQMVEAAATLLRAADGAGLPKREPRDLDLDDGEEEDAPKAAPASPTFELINNLVAQVIPMVMTGFVGKKINVGNALDWRKAAAQGQQQREVTPALDAPTAASASEPTAPVSLPSLDPQTMAHFITIQAALKPEEAALAKQIAAELSPLELQAWIAELSKLSVPQAVQKIRVLVAGNTEAVS
jgi:hypothetical protein